MPCYIVEYLHESFPGTMKNPYPSCAAFTSGENLLQETMVTTNWDLNDLPGITAGLRFGYAVGGWLGFVIHAIGVEVYVSGFFHMVILLILYPDKGYSTEAESKGLIGGGCLEDIVHACHYLLEW
jgi:hypothetical protein